MAKATSTPISFSLTRKFEELPLFTTAHAGVQFFTGLLDGEFTVQFDQAGEWIISDVALKVDNGKLGSQAECKIVTLDGDKNEQLYLVILDALTDRYAGSIPYWISEELAHFNISIAA